MTAAACYNCGGADLSAFYEVDSIPVHSVLLMSSKAEALGYPTGDLRLGFCGSCGFVQNLLFDPAVHEYSTRCEESQGFSETFNRFARQVARAYIDRYDLRGKRVLEIGCGKGDFLVELCEMGPCTGIGIDPGYRPERTRSEAASRIEFIQDFYSEKYSHLQADFVCCRHTLEHVQPTLEFVQMIRRSIGDRKDTIVAFELPDISRVLKEQAFWDIYYEHCSYFSLGSLARLFRSCGLEPIVLETGFDEQYLLIDARISNGGPQHHLDGEDDLDELRADVEIFKREVPRRLAGWTKLLDDNLEQGKRTVVWGSTSKAVSFLTTLGVGDQVGYVTDINPHRQNMFIPGSGHKIVPPADLVDYRPDVVIAMNPVYLDEIRADLAKMGLEPELLAL